jgi:predicted transcriptional regulator
VSEEREEVAPEVLLAHTSQIVSSYVSANTVSKEALPELIAEVYAGLVSAMGATNAQALAEPLEPAVPIEQSLTDDAIICLEDGLSFQSLKRHLRVKYDLSPDAYRKKWGLPADYPMVAPNYAKRRSELAKRTGLGRHRP